MNASSFLNDNHKPQHGRLNFSRGGARGWCPEKGSDENQWLQVDFGRTFRVCGVATKGAKKGTRWTTAFTLSFSNDSSQWSQYVNGNGKNMVRNKSLFE